MPSKPMFTGPLACQISMMFSPRSGLRPTAHTARVVGTQALVLERDGAEHVTRQRRPRTEGAVTFDARRGRVTK